MKLKGIRISREAKILFGLMCLAAAILIWVNLATQRFPLFGGQQDATVVPSTSSTPVASTGDATVTAPDAAALDSTATQSDAATDTSVAVDTAVLEAPTLDSGTTEGTEVAPDATLENPAPVAGSMVDISAISPDGTAPVVAPEAVTPAAEAAPAVAPSVTAAPIAARDVQLAELPFLVTEAPVAPVEEATEEAAATETTRPGEQRASINPFSPIVLAPVEAPVAQVDPQPIDASNLQPVEVPTNPEPITVVESGLAGSVNEVLQEPLVAEGPLPEAVLPAPAVASLPRPLPMATTPVAPEILRDMSRTPASASTDLGPTDIVAPAIVEVPAAIREPVQAATPTPVMLSTSTVGAESSDVELEPLGALSSTATSASAPANGAPLYAGASPLSSYLRNNDVRFTGYAVGPVSVGIFRSAKSANPVVVTLGQSLPETEFVLTNLQGKEAEFTYGQEKQLLTLDLRR
jgi:hypothetical protein